MNWQTWSALGIVGITLMIFIVRLCHAKKKPTSCGKACDCFTKPKS